MNNNNITFKWKITYFSDFNQTWIFLAQFVKAPISNFMKIFSVGTEVIHVDKRKDGRKGTRDKSKMLFHDYAKALKN